MIPCIKSCMCKQYLMELLYRIKIGHERVTYFTTLWSSLTKECYTNGILFIKVHYGPQGLMQYQVFYKLHKEPPIILWWSSFRHGKPLLSFDRLVLIHLFWLFMSDIQNERWLLIIVYFNRCFDLAQKGSIRLYLIYGTYSFYLVSNL